MDLISAIIPVYRVEQYIEDCILSIVHQTYKNIEIILIDDGSDDASIILAENILVYSKANYKIISQKNSGLPSARNKGLVKARGKYVAFIDSDDIVEKNHFELLFEVCKNNQLLLACSDFENTYSNNRFGSPSSITNTNITVKKEIFLKDFLLRKPTVHCCSLLIDREFLMENNIFFNSKLRFGEDVEFMWRLFHRIDKIGKTNKKTYKYYIRNNGIMSKISFDKGKVFVKEFSLTIKNESFLYPEMKKILDQAYFRNIIGFLNSYARGCENFKEFYKMYNEINKKNMITTLKQFPDKTIFWLSIILVYFPKQYYRIYLQIIRRKSYKKGL